MMTSQILRRERGLARCFATRSALLLEDFIIKGKKERSGAIVKVAGGYLRNCLMPKNIAVPATKRNIAAFHETKGVVEPPRTMGPNNELITYQPSHKQDLETEELFQRFEDTILPPKKPLSTKYRGPMNRYR